MNEEDHIGKTLCRVNISVGVSPALEGILDCTEAKARAKMKALERRLHALLDDTFGKGMWCATLPRGKVFEVEATVRPCKTREQRKEESNRALAELGDLWAKVEAARQKATATHPDNGKAGWWHVSGIRHDQYVEASSALEAIDKASDVGSWEAPEASYCGPEHPDVARAKETK